MPAGRPTIYSEEIEKDAWDYVHITQDVVRNDVREINIPTIEGLAMHLQVSRSTVYLWQKEHPEFSDIIELLQQKQAVALVNNGLGGNYNPTIAKVLLTKHGYSDKTEVYQKTEHSGGITIEWTDPKVPDPTDQGSDGKLPGLQEGL